MPDWLEPRKIRQSDRLYFPYYDHDYLLANKNKNIYQKNTTCKLFFYTKLK
jgi:hypothetical protein